MYQVIDEQDDEDLVQPRGWSVLPFIIGAILAAIVFFGVWLFSPGRQITSGNTVETPASRSAYLVALSEPNPAVRRARLMDYQRAYPESDRTIAIENQLDVINTAELTAWEKLSASIYNEKLQLDEKWSAMANYEMAWNGSLLGGRGEDLTALKEVLDTAKPVVELPDRTLEPRKSPIPENIPSDRLAGAPPQMAKTFPIYVPPPAPEPVVEEIKDLVVQPTVRKNSSPNYPRTAKRKNIGAVVVVSMNVNAKGRVEDVDIVSIEAERYQKDFRKAAIRAAKRTRFNPKTVNGEAVPAMDVRKRYIFQSNQ